MLPSVYHADSRIVNQCLALGEGAQWRLGLLRALAFATLRVMSARERLRISDAELSRPALVLSQRFVQRWDLYARQLEDGSYTCVHEPLNVSHLFAHLRGEITLGTYLLDQENRARCLVLDADDSQSWERLVHLARELAGDHR